MMTIILYLTVSWLTWDLYWIANAGNGGSEGFGFRLLVLGLGLVPLAIDISYLHKTLRLFWRTLTGG